MERFAHELTEHGGQPEQIEHACMDMSAAYALRVATSLPQTQINYDRFRASTQRLQLSLPCPRRRRGWQG